MKLYKTSATVEYFNRPENQILEKQGSRRPFFFRLTAYLQLTKPKIMLLVLITGAAALMLEGSLMVHPAKFFIFLIGLYMTGGAANAFNQYFETDIDARMMRTMKKRPLPAGRISRLEAVVFSTVLGALGVVILYVTFNFLTALLALGTILFYSLVYTLWLKPNTSQNIVIGGIAGAMAPVGAWSAATGSTAITPWLLFLIIFLWTPPHFWSLALCFRDDYRAARLPMLPVIKGSDATLRHILYYSYMLVAVSLFYGVWEGNWLYAIVAISLGMLFITKAHLARWRRNQRSAWSLFTFSIIYLLGVFMAMVADRILIG
jgi:protoheme IX farnesyltransferase